MLIALSAATIYMYVIRLSEYEDRQHYALIEAALNIPNYANRIKHMSVLDFIMIFSAPAINMADAATGMPQKLTIDNAYVTDGVDSLIYGPQIIVAPNLPAISIKCQIAYFYLGREYIPSLDGALMRASGQNIRGVYYVRYSKFCKYANVGVTEAVYIDTDDGNYIGLPGDAVKNILGEIGIPFLGISFTPWDGGAYISSRIDAKLKRYVHPAEHFVIIHVDAITGALKNEILKKAGRIYATTPDALLDIYFTNVINRSQISTSIEGLSARLSDLMIAAPMICFVLTAMLLNRLRVLQGCWLTTTTPWYIRDTSNTIERIFALTIIAAPIISTFVIFGAFSEFFNERLFIWHYAVNFPRLIGAPLIEPFLAPRYFNIYATAALIMFLASTVISLKSAAILYKLGRERKRNKLRHFL